MRMVAMRCTRVRAALGKFARVAVGVPLLSTGPTCLKGGRREFFLPRQAEAPATEWSWTRAPASEPARLHERLRHIGSKKSFATSGSGRKPNGGDQMVKQFRRQVLGGQQAAFALEFL